MSWPDSIPCSNKNFISWLKIKETTKYLLALDAPKWCKALVGKDVGCPVGWPEGNDVGMLLGMLWQNDKERKRKR